MVLPFASLTVGQGIVLIFIAVIIYLMIRSTWRMKQREKLKQKYRR